MTRFEPIVLERKPVLVLVYGDVNSTVAAALVCSKLMIQVGHVEAGLRSRDRTCRKKSIDSSRTSLPICCLHLQPTEMRILSGQESPAARSILWVMS